MHLCTEAQPMHQQPPAPTHLARELACRGGQLAISAMAETAASILRMGLPPTGPRRACSSPSSSSSSSCICMCTQHVHSIDSSMHAHVGVETGPQRACCSPFSSSSSSCFCMHAQRMT
eukprot:1160000-Pelagomonas_calceolata.AAC.14